MGNRDESRMTEFGRILERYMSDKNMKAKDLAERIDISPVVLSKMIGGVLRPRSDILPGIEKELGLNPVEMTELRHAANRARMESSHSLTMDRGPRHSMTRLSDSTMDRILHRIRRDCGFKVENIPAEAPVRCDLLISNPDVVGKQVGLIFLFQPRIDPAECVKIAQALKVFYEGLEGVLFYRPWLDHDDLAHREILRQGGAEFVYDWTVIAGIARRLPPTLQAEEWIARTNEAVRTILKEPLSPRSGFLL